MSCSGCQLSWSLSGSASGYAAISAGSLANVGTSLATTPTFTLLTFNSQPWLTVQGIVSTISGVTSHGLCSGTSGCAEVSPCVGDRSLNYTVMSGYVMNVAAYNITNGNPFHCGETDYITVYATSVTGGAPMSIHNTLSIKCGDC